MCPLCHSAKIDKNYHHDKRRNYFSCQNCHLVFVPPEHFLSREDEKAAYDHHQNSPTDRAYRQFLSRLFVPMQSRLHSGSQGLDFGCGPGPTLSKMFEEAGHSVALYDVFYAPDRSVLHQSYDFITTSEVVEHLHDPYKQLDELWTLLKPGGLFGIMTKRVHNRDRFASWHYKNDLTHVCFFSELTFQWLAQKWKATMIIADKDVVLLKKTS